MNPTLHTTLSAIDWRKNVIETLSDAHILASLEKVLFRVAVWAKQFASIEGSNPAIGFNLEMQVAAQQSVILISLGLYKPSAATTRTLLESCQYYTFFRTHLMELETLVRDADYYVTSTKIVEYHKIHTKDFAKNCELFGLLGRIKEWYSRVSAIVHGQVPGVWNTHTGLSDVATHKATIEAAVKNLIEAEQIVHDLLLCTVGQQLWASFAPDAKNFLIKGMTGAKKDALGIDAK